MSDRCSKASINPSAFSNVSKKSIHQWPSFVSEECRVTGFAAVIFDIYRIISNRIESNRIELYRIVLRSWSRRICEVCWQLFQQNVFVCVLKSTTRLEKIFENKWAYSVDDWLVVIGESRKVFVDSARTHDKNKFGHEQSNDSHVSYVQFPIVRYSGEFWRFADKYSPRYERVILVRPRDTRDATCYRHEKTGIRKKDALLSQHGIRRLQRYRSSCQGATTRGIR